MDDGTCLGVGEITEPRTVRDAEFVEQPSARDLSEARMHIECLHDVRMREISSGQEHVDGSRRRDGHGIDDLRTQSLHHLESADPGFHGEIVVVVLVAHSINDVPGGGHFPTCCPHDA